MFCGSHIFVSLWQDTVRGCVSSEQNPETRTRLASVKPGRQEGVWQTELKVPDEQG